MIGTPQYMAPEQAKGRAIDHRADIYALGCVAFEMLTGRPPFEADNAMEMVAKHLMEVAPRPRKLEPRIPSELDALIVKMLAKNRDDRPTLTEVAAVLDRVLKQPALRDAPTTDLGTSAVAVSRPHRRPVWLRARTVLLVLGPIAMAVVAYVTVKALASSHAPPAATEPAATEPAATEPAAAPTSAEPIITPIEPAPVQPPPPNANRPADVSGSAATTHVAPKPPPAKPAAKPVRTSRPAATAPPTTVAKPPSATPLPVRPPNGTAADELMLPKP